MKTLRNYGASTAAENALKFSLEFWLNILGHYYSEYMEERQKLNHENLSSDIHSCMESEKFLQKKDYESGRATHKELEDFLHIQIPTDSPGVSDFVESFLLIASRTIAEKESRPSSPGKQCNRISHFELN